MTWVPLITVLVALAAAVIPLYREVRKARLAAVRAEGKATQAAGQAAEVHHIVNQQRTDMQRYQEVLVDAMVAGGLPIPPDASLKVKTPQELEEG